MGSEFSRDAEFPGDAFQRCALIPDPRSAAVPGAPVLLVSIENSDQLAHTHSQAAGCIAAHNDCEDSSRSRGVKEPIWLAVTTYVDRSARSRVAAAATCRTEPRTSVPGHRNFRPS